jgi:hypothetical protein
LDFFLNLSGRNSSGDGRDGGVSGRDDMVKFMSTFRPPGQVTRPALVNQKPPQSIYAKASYGALTAP